MALPSWALVRFHGPHFPTQNPALNFWDHGLVRLAGRTQAEAHMERPEQASDGIEGVVPLRDPQPLIVHVSQRAGFRGPVVLLISVDSVSAAETFTMALLDRQPHVVRVRSNTQGVFSDVLEPTGYTALGAAACSGMAGLRKRSLRHQGCG